MSQCLHIEILVQPTNGSLIIDVWVEIVEVRRDHGLKSQGRVRRNDVVIALQDDAL